MTYYDYSDIVRIIAATPDERAERGDELSREVADRAIRLARRRVQQYGESAIDELLAHCTNGTEVFFVLHAVSPLRRVGPVVDEWVIRTEDETWRSDSIVERMHVLPPEVVRELRIQALGFRSEVEFFTHKLEKKEDEIPL